jgi:hypothetical protein
MKIIIVRLSGGLGNQLFEYATGRMLSEKYNGYLLLDDSGYEQDSYGRSCAIQNFRIKARLLSKQLWKNFITPGNRFYSIVQRLTFIEWKTENSFSIHYNLFEINKFVCCLNGYWQTEEYFKNIRSLLLMEISLPKQGETIKQIVDSKNPLVAVHVRHLHGIHANPTIPRDLRYGTLGLNYYLTAMRKIADITGIVSFVFFSDDVAWCKETFSDAGFDIHFIDDYSTKSDFEQLILMSQCDHHIVSNSTFSWWGAWLCDTNKNIVIRPERPFNDASLLYEKHFPAKWLVC